MTKDLRYYGKLGTVRTEHRFDTKALEAYLHETVAGYEGPLTIRQFEGGQSNPTYLLETPRQNYVLRRKPPGPLLKSAHAVDREYRVMEALFNTAFPVPRPYSLCEDEDVIGTMFFVMDYVPGRIFKDCSMPDLERDERTAIFDSVNATIAQLHAIDPAAVGLGDFGKPGNYFARQVSRWSKQYEASQTTNIAEMQELIDWLPAHLPPESKPAIVHGDFSFHNIVVHPSEPRVVAVLDWELSTLGDPMADLMYHGMEWYRPPGLDDRGTLLDKDLNALGVPSLESYVARYCHRVGRTPPKDLGFYRAFNLFRVAAIVQGIVGRAIAGTANAAGAASLADKVKPLAQAAWREAQRAEPI